MVYRLTSATARYRPEMPTDDKETEMKHLRHIEEMQSFEHRAQCGAEVTNARELETDPMAANCQDCLDSEPNRTAS